MLMEQIKSWLTSLFDPTTGHGGILIAVVSGLIVVVLVKLFDKNGANNIRIDNKVEGDSIIGDKVGGDKVCGDKNITYSGVDKATELLQAKKIDEATRLLEIQKNQISLAHPKHPDFCIDIADKHGKLILNSKPTNENVLKEQPQTIKGSFHIDEKYNSLGFKSVSDVLEYSYATQQDIDVNMIEMKKMIGDEDDPFQGELKDIDLEKSHFKIVHHDFPEAKPFKLFIENSDESYDYILLRVYKTEYKKPITYISNKDQNIDIIFDLELNLETKSVKFKIEQNYESQISSSKRLKLLKFLRCIELKNKLTLFSLDMDTVYLVGQMNNFNYGSNQFENVEHEIKFIEMIQIIEKKFNINFQIPEMIDDETIENFTYLITAIEQNGIVQSTWDSFRISVIATDLKNIIQYIENEPFQELKTLKYEQYSINYRLFDGTIVIPKITHVFNNLAITNDELQRLNTILDSDPLNSEEVEIEFVPGNNSKCKDIVEFGLVDDGTYENE